MTRVIQIQSFKGGVGKTTTAINLGHGLAMRDKNVLIIDLDHQANATKGLGYKVEAQTPTLYHVITGVMSYEDSRATVRNNLDLIASDSTTKKAEKWMDMEDGKETIFKRVFEDVNEYDFILLDCPADTGTLHTNALLFATEIIVPVEIGKWAVDGINDIFRSMEQIHKVFKYAPKILGALLTKVDERYSLTDEVRETVNEAFSHKLLPSIRSNSDLMNAPKFNQTIFEYNRAHMEQKITEDLPIGY